MDQTVTPAGVRCSASTAYLQPAMARPNLTVTTGCLVTRVLAADSGGGLRAAGVEYQLPSGGPVLTALAERETILSLGAVGSPQVLLLSGIGPAEHLRSVGVPVLLDLPAVGGNLQDHLEFYVQYLCTRPVTLAPVGNWFPYPHRRIMVGAEWFLRGRGLAASNQFETGGFVRSRAGVPHPDVQLHFVPGAVEGQLSVLRKHAYQAHCGTLRPTSRGTIRLQSADPHVGPLIDPAYLATERDRIDLRNAFRLTEEIMAQPAFDDYRGQALHKDLVDPECDASVDTFIRTHAQSAYHPSCTCAMGQVVDEEGRVCVMRRTTPPMQRPPTAAPRP